MSDFIQGLDCDIEKNIIIIYGNQRYEIALNKLLRFSELFNTADQLGDLAQSKDNEYEFSERPEISHQSLRDMIQYMELTWPNKIINIEYPLGLTIQNERKLIKRYSFIECLKSGQMRGDLYLNYDEKRPDSELKENPYYSQIDEYITEIGQTRRRLYELMTCAEVFKVHSLTELCSAKLAWYVYCKKYTLVPQICSPDLVCPKEEEDIRFPIDDKYINGIEIKFNLVQN